MTTVCVSGRILTSKVLDFNGRRNVQELDFGTYTKLDVTLDSSNDWVVKLL
jgi:hypothetical protein